MLYNCVTSFSSSRLEKLFGKNKINALEADLRDLFKNDNDKNDSKSQYPESDAASKNKPELTKECQHVMLCLQPVVREGITVFDLNGNNDFSDTIFRSVCLGKSTHSNYLSVIVLYRGINVSQRVNGI